MKKFVFLHYGYEPPTEEVMSAWGEWFEAIGERIVDPGSPFSAGKEITQAGTADLPLDREAITGYTVIQAESLDEAVKIAQTCPIITGMRVYETTSMQGHV